MKISKDFSFNSNSHQSISNVKEALDKYAENFESAKNLESGIPIFLDANVLLNYYGMSSSEKEKLIEFITEKSSVITITRQIEKEFIRNRVNVINDYFSSLNKIKSVVEKDLINDIKSKFDSVLQNKILKEDYNEYWTLINSQLEKLNTDLFEETEAKKTLFDSIDEQIKVNKHLKIKDAVLDTYQEFTVTDALEEDELTFLKEEYKKLLTIYKGAKQTVKWKTAFPGCGEKKEIDKADGDFIIYHEILKHMETNSTDAILLTNDVTKEDWISKNGEPFIHYIEKTYLNSKQNLYIFEAKRLLDNISFENIYDEEFHQEEDRSIQVLGTLVVKCDNCSTVQTRSANQMNLDFELNNADERNLGPEYSYRAEEYIQCTCGEEIIVSFEVWEYPIGVHNSDTIESENGKILVKPVISI